MAMGKKSTRIGTNGAEPYIKKTAVLFASVLALTLTTSFPPIPAALAVDSGEGWSETSSIITFSPNPAVKGNAVLIQVQVTPIPKQAPIESPEHLWTGLTLKITSPNGTLTVGGLESDYAGRLNFTYSPPFPGEYSVEFVFPQQTLTFQNLGVPMSITYSIVYRQSNNTSQLTVLGSQPTTTPAQSPSIPEFTVKFVGQPYEVQPTTSTDPYTGTNETVPGYYVSNGTIELSIKNQPYYSSSGDFSFYYEVRFKGHFGGDWTVTQENTFVFTTEDWSSRLGIKPSDSEYTVLKYSAEYSPNSQIDFQVAALLYKDTQVFYSDHPLAPPPYNQAGHYELHPTLFGRSDWSETQTVTVPEITSPQSPIPSSSPSSTPTPTESPSPHALTPIPSAIRSPTQEPSPKPNTPENSAPTIIAASLVIAVTVVITLVYFRRRSISYG